MLNVIAVMGRMVADPELRKTPNGTSTTTFSIACDRSYVKAGGERQTDFFDIVAWRGQAEFVCKYFRKGQLIAVDGSLQTRSYETKDGSKRRVYEIIANNVHFAESKRSSAAPQDADEPPMPRSLPQEPTSAPAPAYASGSADDFAVIDDSEDLPF